MQQHRIALFLPSWYEYSQETSAGISKYIRCCKHLRIRDFGQQTNEGYPVLLDYWKPDGVILSLSNGDLRLVNRLIKLGKPMVNMSSSLSLLKMPTVHIEGGSVAQLAYEHFSKLGYQHFAYVGHSGVEWMGHGYIFDDLLAEQGLSCKLFCLNTYVHHDQDPREEEPGFVHFLRKMDKPVGILAQDAEVGLYICQCCQALNWRIPEDVAVLSIGDMELCHICEPSLSSIVLPGREVGYEAAALMDRMINGQSAPDSPILVPAAEVIGRDSTGVDHRGDYDIERALHFIRDNACKGITVASVMDRQDISRVTFEKRFHKEIGHSPALEIRRVKIDRAKDLLLETDLTVTHIAGMCGFSSCTQFGIIFKKAMGMTPIAFRKHQGQRAP